MEYPGSYPYRSGFTSLVGRIKTKSAFELPDQIQLLARSFRKKNWPVNSLKN
ncbi:Hypothetical protein ACI5QL_02677 [Bacillus velezensis]